MKKIKLGIIYGGLSTEHEVSINSAKSIIDNIDKDKYEIYKIYIDKKGNWYKEDNKIDNIFEYLRNLDVIFPILHGLYGEDGTIEGLFELLGVPYVGCNVLSSSICMDKIYTKMILDKIGIDTAKYIYVKKVKDKYIYINNTFEEKELSLEEISLLVEDSLSFPVFVKPSRSGSSIGINKAHNKEELIKYIKYASGFDSKILIEENIIGRELECAILGNALVEASPIGEILPKGEFYSYNAKYIDDSETLIPNDIDKIVCDKIRSVAVKAYKALDCRGLSRVDFFLEKDTNRIILNEINTMPGFTTISMYPKLWESTGISYKELLDKLINLALEK
ncbi:MAG: D-alanine--D-alanine ligase family protein [Bacilli bacterium]